jgi:hypothetical protein
MIVMTWACMSLAWVLWALMWWDLILYDDEDDKGGYLFDGGEKEPWWRLFNRPQGGEQ